MKETNRIELGKKLLMSPMNEKMKQRLLVLTPKLRDEELRLLLAAFEEGEDAFSGMVASVIDGKKGVRRAAKDDLDRLYTGIGIKNEKQQGEGKELTEVERNEIMKRLQSDPKDLYAFLVMIGPEGLDDLADALEKDYTVGGHGATKEQVDETVKKLREFAAFLYRQEEEMKETYEKAMVLEKIRVEKEKQKILEGAIEMVKVA